LAPWSLALRQAARSARLGLLLFDDLHLLNLGQFLNLEQASNLEVEGVGRIEGSALLRPMVPERPDLDLSGLLDPSTTFEGNDALAKHRRDLSLIVAAGVLKTTPLQGGGGGHLQLPGLLTDEEIEANFDVGDVAGGVDDFVGADVVPDVDVRRLANTVRYAYWLGSLAAESSPVRVPLVGGGVPPVSALADDGTADTSTWRSSQVLADRLLLAAVPGFFDLPIERLLEVRTELRVPMHNFRAAVSAAARELDTGSDDELVSFWVERVKPELEALAAAQGGSSVLRDLVLRSSAADLLSLGGGVTVAIQSPSSLLRALGLAFPVAFTGLRVHLARPGEAAAVHAEHPYFLLHELSTKPQPNRAERRRQARRRRA